jgi:16S rRNA (uracil1498-N3)-methyltransferase
MKIQRFFYHPDPESGVFSEAESKHIVQVLRISEGDAIVLTDGKGLSITAAITEPDRKKCRFTITSKSNQRKPEHEIILGISPIKQRDRFEFAIEKCVEIGVSGIIPIICERTEKEKLNVHRLEQIAISAMKQSKQYWLPEIHSPIAFKNWVTMQYNHKFFGYCDEGISKDNLDSFSINKNSSAIAIGPEGDFTPEEALLALEWGWKAVSLGANRLRTETAAIYAVSVIQSRVSPSGAYMPLPM